MTKIQLFSLSLIGALPAGFLTYLLGMYLISQPTGASSMVMIVAIITLICSAALTITPVLVLSMYYSNYDPPKIAKSRPKADAVEELDEAEEISDSKSDSVVDAEFDEFADDDVSEEVSSVIDDDDFATFDDDEEEKK